MNSRPVWQLDPRSKSFLFGICLSDEDVAGLADWEDVSVCRALAANVWRRNYVHSACRGDTPVARRVTDLLDLRYAGAVLDVRCLDEEGVRTHVRDVLADEDNARLAPLLWALSSDSRAAVQACAQHVMAHCFVVGCRAIRQAHDRGAGGS